MPKTQDVPITEESFNLRDLFVLVLQKWKLLLVAVAIASTSAFLHHFLFASYVSSSIIIVQRTQNSPLQAISAKVSGLSLAYSPLADGYLTKYLLFLETHEFYRHVARAMLDHPSLPEIREKLGVDKISLRGRISNLINGSHEQDPKRLLIENLASRLKGSVTVEKHGPDTIRMRVVAPKPLLSVILSNFLTEMAISAITEGDVKELNEAREYLGSRLKEIEANLRAIDTKLVHFKKESKIVSINSAEADVATRSLSLKKDLEEQTVTLEQNNKLIQLLESEKVSQGPEAQDLKYGTSGRIAQLKRTNQVLNAKIQAIKTILQTLNASETFPKSEQTIVNLTKRMELEYLLFQELKKQLVQIEIEEISFRNKVRRLEEATLAGVNRSSSLSLKVVILVIFALSVAMAAVYIREILTSPKTRPD